MIEILYTTYVFWEAWYLNLNILMNKILCIFLESYIHNPSNFRPWEYLEPIKKTWLRR